MQYNGGKSKTLATKRHFTVVIGNKENGIYVSTTPSSAARKAVTKLCASNKSKKVEFHIREITQGSKKKTYGPYVGYIEKLKEPIELKGRTVEYKPMAKLKRKKMNGGENVSNINQLYSNRVSITFDRLSRNNKNKDNLLKNLSIYVPEQFNHKIFFESLPITTHTKNLMKCTISFETQKGLNWFKSYLSSQGISPNSPDT
jgi:hypothetical protein